MFDLTAEEARLLLTIALMAVGRNRFKSAARILAALERFRPDSPQLAVTKAIALMSALKFAECLDYIDGTALGRFPDDPMLLAFKGMALVRLGRAEDAREVLGAVTAQAANPAAARLAGDLMKEAE